MSGSNDSFDPGDPETWPVVLSVAEMALIRRVPEKRIRQLARVRRIRGAYREGRFWRFKKLVVLRWLTEDDQHGGRP